MFTQKVVILPRNIYISYIKTLMLTFVRDISTSISQILFKIGTYTYTGIIIQYF